MSEDKQKKEIRVPTNMKEIMKISREIKRRNKWIFKQLEDA